MEEGAVTGVAKPLLFTVLSLRVRAVLKHAPAVVLLKLREPSRILPVWGLKELIPVVLNL